MQQVLVWLAAYYHFPGIYSIRVPMTSPYSALAMPAPGPGTVRLALVRAGIELFGLNFVREKIYPIIRSMLIHVRPPHTVAISTQRIRMIKAKTEKNHTALSNSIGYREYCHAQGDLTVYLRVPELQLEIFEELLRAIGYWGQASSLAWCRGIEKIVPNPADCAHPWEALTFDQQVERYFCCLASEFRDDQVVWSEIMPQIQEKQSDALRLGVYVWPMVIREQRSNHKLLTFCSLGQ